MAVLTNGACQLTMLPEVGMPEDRPEFSGPPAISNGAKRHFTAGLAAASLGLEDGFARFGIANWPRPAGDTRRTIPPAHR
jgi:hypothetical protein